MITCERCGKEMSDNAAICPSCGTVSSISRPAPVHYDQNPPSSVAYEYSQGFGQQSVYAPQTGSPSSSRPDYPPQASYPSPPVYPQQQMPLAQQGYAPQVGYPPVAVNVNVVTPIATPVVSPASRSNSGALVVEVLLNFFLGVYGVGWLMAGETTTGIILLICSLVLYWPTVVLGAIFTFGLGLACIGPLAIGALILNVILLNNALKRKAALYMVVPVQPFPPQ